MSKRDPAFFRLRLVRRDWLVRLAAKMDGSVYGRNWSEQSTSCCAHDMKTKYSPLVSHNIIYKNNGDSHAFVQERLFL